MASGSRLRRRRCSPERKQVEGEAQGDENALDKFLQAIDYGPKYAHVVKLDHEDRALVEDEKDFVIRPR